MGRGRPSKISKLTFRCCHCNGLFRWGELCKHLINNHPEVGRDFIKTKNPFFGHFELIYTTKDGENKK